MTHVLDAGVAVLFDIPAHPPPTTGHEPLDTKDQCQMTWFRIDDGLHKHRKRIRCGLDMEGFAALGLWTTAGSWSSDELTDGWIPDDVIDYLAPVIGQQLAKRLERAALWNRVTRDGEEGWQFHEWTDHQPTREQVLAERAAAALRQKRARDRAKEKRDKEGQEGAPSRCDSRVTDADTHGEVTPAVTVPPTRPDPTRPITTTPPSVEPEADDDTTGTLFASPTDAPGNVSNDEPSHAQRAFGIARAWIKHRADQGTPVVASGKSKSKEPGLHKLRNLIEPFTEEYTDLEIKQALHGIGVSIPTTSRLDAALAQIRTNARNQQQPRQDGLPARYERRGAVTYSDRQDAGRESAQARKFRECLEIADELDRQFAQNGGRS